MSQIEPEHVLVHAPYGRDAKLICHFLGRAGVSAGVCRTVEDLCSEIREDTGAALISDESLTKTSVEELAAVLKRQPPWSDLPFVVTTSGGEATDASRRRLDLLESLGNASLLERPVRAVTLVNSVKTALRARRRQYQLRENFAERERLVRELERSNDELAQFAHVVSHDLQAPIRMMRSFSQLLARRYQGQLDAKAHEFIGIIQAGAEAMDTLIQTLLKYASAGQEPMTLRKVRLASVVEAVLTTLRPTIEELGAEVSYGDLPIVQGDRVLLEQLMQNLLTNALKYCDPQIPPHVSISATQDESDWRIAVKDNGLGIAPEHHARIFLPLKRLHGSEISGTGIGLAVCRKIVERHGGKTWVDSEAGQGATFYFTLPGVFAKQTLNSAEEE